MNFYFYVYFHKLCKLYGSTLRAQDRNHDFFVFLSFHSKKRIYKATSYKVKNGLLKMGFSDEPISNKVF